MKVLPIICILFLSFSVFSQDLDQEQLKVLSETYVFCKVQQTHLNHIARNFPALDSQRLKATKDFNSVFGKSCYLLEKYIPQDTINEINNQVARALDNRFAKNANVAKNYLNLVEKRAIGDIESPYKETLLVINPDIYENPEIEFTKGYINEHKLVATTQTKKLNYYLHLPASWKENQTKSTNSTAFRQNSVFSDGVDAFIIVKEGEAIDRSLAIKVLSKGEIEDFVKGTNVLESGSLNLVGQPSGYVIFQSPPSKNRTDTKTITMLYMIYYNARMVSIYFTIRYSNDERQGKLKMAKYRPLFDLIANSFSIIN